MAPSRPSLVEPQFGGARRSLQTGIQRPFAGGVGDGGAERLVAGIDRDAGAGIGPARQHQPVAGGVFGGVEGQRAGAGRGLGTLQDLGRPALVAGQQHGKRRWRALAGRRGGDGQRHGIGRAAGRAAVAAGRFELELAVAGGHRRLGHQYPLAARIGGDLADRLAAVEHRDPVAGRGAAGDDGLPALIDGDDVEARERRRRLAAGEARLGACGAWRASAGGCAVRSGGVTRRADHRRYQKQHGHQPVAQPNDAPHRHRPFKGSSEASALYTGRATLTIAGRQRPDPTSAVLGDVVAGDRRNAGVAATPLPLWC